MRTLERITVTGYKSIKELRDFELGDLNVLIGANGAGKSNFLSVFKMLDYIVGHRLQLYVGKHGGAGNILHFGHKVTNEIQIKLEINETAIIKDFLEINFIPTFPDQLVFSKEKYSRSFSDGRPDWELESGSGHVEISYFKSSKPSVLDSIAIQKIISQWKMFHFQDTTPEAKIKQNPDIHDNYELRADAANLASFLYLLKNHQQDYYNRILRTVKLAAPFIEDFILHPMPENAQRIRLRWQHKNSEDDFDISQLSDGTLRFICLTTLLLQPNPPSLIIIDEPELGLHPYAITVLAGMLRSVSTQTQIIISTQSVSLVNEFQPENIIVVDRKDDASTFTRFTTEELAVWLEDYSLGELWETNLIGGRP